MSKETAPPPDAIVGSLRERVRVLEEALRKYGQHFQRCNTNDPFYGLPCTCGLDAALLPSAAATEGGEGE